MTPGAVFAAHFRSAASFRPFRPAAPSGCPSFFHQCASAFSVRLLHFVCVRTC